MAQRTWVRQVNDPTDPNVRRTTGQLVGRTQYLRERVDAAEFGQAVFAHDVTLDPDLLEGQPVYWNDAAQRFEAALAAAETDDESGNLVAAASANCIGVLYAKEFSTKGHVLLSGYAPLDISNASEDTSSGRYYLSSSEPGKLTKQRPGVSVPVLFLDGSGNAYVQPALHDFAQSHAHYRFDLRCYPAGTAVQPDQGDPHTITNPDPSLRGWLPASEFGGRAPAKAVFGYNLAAHPDLQRVWPPVPLSAVSLFWDKGDEHRGGSDIPVGSDGLVIVDRFGIWWTSDCYADVPWPTATNTATSSEASEPSLGSGEGPECPRFEKMRLVLAFAKMSFATADNAVTSLRPADGSPIRFRDCDGNEKSTGDLFASFDTDFVVSDADTDGSVVFKQLDGTRFKAGYVAEGVRAENENLTVSGSRTKQIGAETFHQGLITLSVNLDPAARDVPVQLVRLDDVKERFYQDVMYLGFPAGVGSSIRGKVKVPGAGLPAGAKLKLRIQLLGRANGTLPDLTVTYRILPRPTSGNVALPTTDSAVDFDSAVAVTTDQYAEVESGSFSVSAGDTVLFTVSRADDDGYAGEVGLLDVVGVLFAGP